MGNALMARLLDFAAFLFLFSSTGKSFHASRIFFRCATLKALSASAVAYFRTLFLGIVVQISEKTQPYFWILIFHIYSAPTLVNFLILAKARSFFPDIFTDSLISFLRRRAADRCSLDISCCHLYLPRSSAALLLAWPSLLNIMSNPVKSSKALSWFSRRILFLTRASRFDPYFGFLLLFVIVFYWNEFSYSAFEILIFFIKHIWRQWGPWYRCRILCFYY